MPPTIPESHRDLFDKPLTVTLATVLPDGQPHLTAVWINYEPDGDLLVACLNTAQKAINIAHTPKATVMAIDTEQPFRYIEVRCDASILSDDIEEITRIRKQIVESYGRPHTADVDMTTRVILRLTPTKVIPHGRE